MVQEYRSAKEVFDYDDIMLVPGKCVVKSRSEVDVSTTFGKETFQLPIVPANMSTIVDENTAMWLAKRGYFYVMHRFDVDPVEFTKVMQGEDEISSISLGIKPADYEILERFRREAIAPDYITVDVAHGDSEEVIRMVKTIRSLFSTVFIIAGNIATVEGAQRLADAGADAVKVGIGPGMACLTAPNTGFGSRGWQLSAVAHVSEALDASHPHVKIIADGGIRTYGDIAKSIAFGADMVMIGGMLSGHDENPGEVLEMDGERKKAFFGSASEHQKGEHKHVEGQRLYMPYKGSLATTLQIVKENLQSSVSYAGGKELHALRQSGFVKLK